MAHEHTPSRLETIAIKPKKSRYVAAIAAFGLITAVAILLWFVPAGIHVGDHTLQYGHLLSAFCFVYFIASWQAVQTDEMAGIMVLEVPAKEVGAGWHFVPLWIAELHRVPLSVQQIQFPGDPEKVFKGKDDQPLPQGMFRPIRATTHAPKENASKDDKLNVQMTVEITFSVRWMVRRDSSFFTFFINIPGRNWAEKKANVEQQMRDSGETDLIEEIAEHTLGEVLSDIATINRKLSTCIQVNVEDWGISIREARMQTPDLTHDLNRALAAIPTARAKLEATITNARGEKIRLTEEGAGRAAAIKAEVAARGEGLKAAADALGMEGAEYASLETVREAVGEGDLIIGTEGVEKLLGLGKAVLGSGKR